MAPLARAAFGASVAVSLGSTAARRSESSPAGRPSRFASTWLMVKNRTGPLLLGGSAIGDVADDADSAASSRFFACGFAAASPAIEIASIAAVSSNAIFETEKPAPSCARTYSSMSAAQVSAGTRNADADKVRTRRYPGCYVGQGIASGVLNRGKGTRISGSDGECAANGLPTIQEGKIGKGKI